MLWLTVRVGTISHAGRKQETAGHIAYAVRKQPANGKYG